eukprot:7736-Heterococcus_DN1.PRE.1
MSSIDTAAAVFTNLRVAYAALTCKLYGNESNTINEALERQMQAWLAQCLPLTKLSKSPVFLNQCCAICLALSLSPAACHRAGSVTVDNHVGQGPKDLMSANSIVLKVLPLLLRICCMSWRVLCVTLNSKCIASTFLGTRKGFPWETKIPAKSAGKVVVEEFAHTHTQQASEWQGLQR